jgi:outer membrane protein OmpA-like peptidoglycan-associated protein
MKTSRLLLLVLALWFALGLKPSIAAPDEYDDSQSNPLRIVAYLAYPVAFLTEWTIFRPFHYLVSGTRAQEALFGHTPHPPVLADPYAYLSYGEPLRRPPVQEPQAAVTPAPQPVVAPEPPPEKVKIVEVPVEKIVVKEVTKVVEVERVVFPSIAFRFDSAELTDLGKGQVYLAAERLKEKSDFTIAIEGHTDNVGNDEYNQKLGMRRAETIMKELAALGVDPGRMSAASVGESKPLINQETEWARAVNRRVEFQVKAAQ